MTFQGKYQKAQRKKTMARIILYGTDGSGKTYTALEIARMLSPAGDILVIDTEQAGEDVPRSGQYDHFEHFIHAVPYNSFKKDPRTVYDRLSQAIMDGIESGADVVIVDSWSDETAAYNLQAEATGDDKNYYKNIKPLRRDLNELIKNAPCHMLLCQRSLEKGVWGISPKTGKETILRMALEPIGSGEIGFAINLRLAMENGTARVAKTIYPEIPSEAQYDVAAGDKALYDQILIALDNGLVIKERFKYELKRRGFQSKEQWKELWAAIPALGEWSQERHDEMLVMVDAYIAEKA